MHEYNDISKNILSQRILRIILPQVNLEVIDKKSAIVAVEVNKTLPINLKELICNVFNLK